MTTSELPPELLEPLTELVRQIAANPSILIALILAATPLVRALRGR